MERFSRLMLDLYGSAHDCSVAEFDSHALGRIKQVVGFDSAAVIAVTFTPADGKSAVYPFA